MIGRGAMKRSPRRGGYVLFARNEDEAWPAEIYVRRERNGRRGSQ